MNKYNDIKLLKKIFYLKNITTYFQGITIFKSLQKRLIQIRQNHILRGRLGLGF